VVFEPVFRLWIYFISFFELRQHLMPGSESFAPPEIFNAVREGIDEGESLPFYSFTDGFFEVLNMLRRTSGVKITGIGGNDSLNIYRRKGIARGTGRSFDFFGCGRSHLPSGHAVDLIVDADYGYIDVPPGGVKQMIAPDSDQVSVSAEYKDF
jgi:hypothetical protein